MQSRALFSRPSVRSKPLAADVLWSVIVPAAWPLTDRLSGWSPSSGGGNESGLRYLLLSATSNTLFVSPSTYLGHLTLFDARGLSSRFECVCADTLEPTPWLWENSEWSIAAGFYRNQLPSQFLLRLIWCSKAAESAQHSGTHFFPALHCCPSSCHDLSGSTEALTEWRSHKLWPSALYESFERTNLIIMTPRCLSTFLVHGFLLFELQWGGWRYRPAFSIYTCDAHWLFSCRSMHTNSSSALIYHTFFRKKAAWG